MDFALVEGNVAPQPLVAQAPRRGLTRLRVRQGLRRNFQRQWEVENLGAAINTADHWLWPPRGDPDSAANGRALQIKQTREIDRSLLQQRSRRDAWCVRGIEKCTVP